MRKDSKQKCRLGEISIVNTFVDHTVNKLAQAMEKKYK